MFFITKSANSLDFLRQNLEILGGKEGEIVKTDYRQRWIEPLVLQSLPRKGERACIVFGDPPWHLYVPIRYVTFNEDVRIEGEKYIFSFSLGERVETPNLGAFTESLRIASQNQYFIIKSATAVTMPTAMPEKQAWRMTIQNMVGVIDDKTKTGVHHLERYLSSVFLRIDGTFTNQETKIDLSAKNLELGHQYTIALDCYAPHLLEEKISQMEIVGIADPPILGMKSILVSRDARLSLKMTPVYAGKTNLKIWIQPEQTRSSQIALSCEAIEGEQPAALPEKIDLAASISTQESVTLPEINQIQLQALYRQLLSIFPNSHDLTHEYKRQLAHELERLPLDVDSQRFLQEEQGVFTCLQEKFEDSYRLLESIGIERIRSQEAVAAYFISAWKTNKTPDLRLLVDRFEISNNPTLTAQIRELLPWQNLISQQTLLESLYISGLFTANKIKQILAPERNGETIVLWIKYVVDERILAKEEAYRLMREWLEKDPSVYLTAADQVARLAFDYGIEAGEDVAYLFDRFGSKLLSEKEIERAKKLYQMALTLDISKRMRFYEALADLTKDYDSPEWRNFTGDLFMDIGRYYLRHPDRKTAYFHSAGEYLRNARAAYRDAKKTDLRDLEREWEELSKETSVIKDYLAQFDEHKHGHLRELLQDKKVVFVGGLTMDFDPDQTARKLGFSSGEHVELHREKGGDLGSLIKRIKSGKVDYVIDIISFTPHHNELKNACQASKSKGQKIHHVMYNSRSFQFSAFLSALFEYHKEDLLK